MRVYEKMNAGKAWRRENYFVMIGLCLAVGIVFLSGCGTKTSEKPDLSSLGQVQVITREDGSGTKEQFETLLNIRESGSAKTASSTEEVIKEVRNNSSAVGYVALSALPEATEEDPGVKILSIDGITPSADTLKNGKYPLTRNYYLAWLGEQNDLEQEFMTYVLGAGQKYAASYAVPVSKETSFLSLRPAGTLTISGSTSMTPMMQEMVKGYENYNPDAQITVTESDSSDGLIDAMQGKCDFAMSSRDLKDYEQNVLSSKAVALDGIAVIVHPDNPLTDLTEEEVKELFDGSVTNWSDL